MKLREVLDIIQKISIENLEKECYYSEIEHFGGNYYSRENVIVDVKIQNNCWTNPSCSSTSYSYVKLFLYVK